ncbi:VWA domain-containing protein [Leptospira semungkisensis]|uniref:VWA domain-containing protein n=1 Tax=Leptospira semungkisensis TaxID=2484985 RepID=A0A4R9G8G7_9LEPT|nr:vWA domain-containing protein [Leptospira semungkisensis]TGK07157.1 VWA domain-containing protein [Leptospira semungkisensis]
MSINFLILILVLLLLTTNDAIATTIAFLPGSWEGQAPQSIEGTGEKPFELARLGQFYATRIYSVQLKEQMINSSDPEIKDFLIPQLPRDKFKQTCYRLKADYVVRDMIEIHEKIRIDRSVYDCNLSKMEEYSVIGRKDVFDTIERLTKESFPLVPKKQKKEIHNKELVRANKTQIFVLDASYSYAPERKEFMSQLEAISWQPETKFRLIVFSENGSKVFPESSRSEFIKQWKDFKSEGKSDTEHLTNALLKLRRVLASEDSPGKKKERTVTILTNAKAANMINGYGSAIEGLRQLGAPVSILYSSYSGPESRREHKEAAKRGAQFNEITYFQRVATTRDSKTLVFKEGKLYTTPQTPDSKVNLETTDMEKVEFAGKYSVGEFLNPWSLSSIYEEVRKEKVLTSEPVRSNFSSQFAKIVSLTSNSEYFGNFPKALIKSGSKAFWIRIPLTTGFGEGKKGLWAATFLSSSFSSEGVEVIPESLESYPFSPAKTLECDPSIARNYFRNTEKFKFDCLVRGEILEVSQP